MIELFLDGQTLAVHTPLVVAGTVDYLSVKLHRVSEEWQGLDLHVYFEHNDVVFETIVNGDYIGPEEHLNLIAGKWDISVSGYITENGSTVKKVTTNTIGLTVAPAPPESGSPMPNLPPDAYVRPEMFGAVCDGTTDDADALQACVNAAATKDVPVYISRSMYINKKITVPSRVRIGGLRNNEETPYIRIGSGVGSVAFTFGIRNIVENIGFMSSSGAYTSGITCLQFNGNWRHDVDSVVDGVIVAYFEKGIEVNGRNVEIKNSLLSHCRIGVKFDCPYEDVFAGGMRGWQVENCRFHGIGEEAALNWFQNSYAIYCDFNKSYTVGGSTQYKASNLTVRNNIFDQGGCAIYGKMSNALIENNFIESYGPTDNTYEVSIIQIIKGADASESGTPIDNGSIIIQGNYIKGKRGQVQEDPAVSVGYPTHAVVIDTVIRCAVLNNSISFTGEQSIVVTSVNFASVSGNLFQNPGSTDNTKNYAVHANGATVSIHNNQAFTTGNGLVSLAGVVSLAADGNNGFALPSSGFTPILEQKWTSVGTIKGNTDIAITLPDEFIVRKDADADFAVFHCYKIGDYITTGVFNVNQFVSYILSWYRYTDDDVVKIQPKLTKLDISTAPPTYSGYASTMTVLAPFN